MRKSSLYFACFFMLVLMGCGDTSGDPTAQITKLEALPADVTPGGSTVITATVEKVIGKTADTLEASPALAPGWGENVTFRLLTANGGQLSSTRQKTDSKGEAKIVFTAGNNLTSDTIQATLDNGMSANIVIKKTGSLVGVIISSFVALPTTVTEGQTSVITAKVTDGSNTNPMLGEPVTFTMATNESGACFINSVNACVASVTAISNAFGNAVAIYRAGGGRSTEEVHDTVRGALTNGSSSAVIITRSVGPAGAVLALTASPTTVGDGQTSVITATVSGGTGNGANETVTLSIPINYSGASFINAAGAGVSTITITTGTGGIASAVYRAGANDSGTIVQDTVQGVLSNGAMSAVSITRSAGTSGAVLALSASPNVVNGGQTSVITVTVSGGASSGANEAVFLTIPVNNSGASFINAAGASVPAITITTGSGGIASVIYKAGTTGSGTEVQDTIQGILPNGTMNAVTISVNTGGTRFIVAVTADPSLLASRTGTSLVMATVVDTAGVAQSGASVTFACPGVGGCAFGTVQVPGPVITDGAGNAVSSYRGKNVSSAGSDVVVATVTIPGVAGTFTGAVTISVP